MTPPLGPALPIDPPAVPLSSEPEQPGMGTPAPLRSPFGASRRWWRGITWTPAFIGYLVYTFVIVTYRLPIGTAAAALAMLGLAFQRTRFRLPLFVILLFASLLWAVLGGFSTAYGSVVNEALLDRLKVCLIALVAVNAVRSGPQVRFFLLFLLASYMLFPIRSVLVNYYITGYTEFGRAVGPAIYNNSNDLAALAILALSVALTVVSIERRPGPVRWGAMVAVALLVLTILLTKSRGAFLATAVMMGPAGFSLIVRNPRKLLSVVALATIVVLGTPASVWDRFVMLKLTTQADEIDQFDPEGSARERFEILRTAARITGDNPVFGVGLGAYALANADYNPGVGVMDTHNTYLNLAAEVGLPGLLLFLVLTASVLRRSRQARRRVRRQAPQLAQAQRWLELGLIGYLTAGIFGSYSKLIFPYVFMALIWSHAEVLRKLLPPPATAAARRRG